MADCGSFDFACSAGAAVGGFLSDLAKGVVEGVGKGFGAVGTVWVRVDVPELTDKAAVSSAVAGENGGGTEGLVTILSYITWVSGVLAVGALMVLAVLFAVKRDQGLAITDRIVMVLAGVIVLSGGTSIVAALLPAGPQGVGGTVHFLQASTWWYTVAGALLGVLIGGAKMIAQQRATAGKELVQSLVTLILVAAGGVTVVNLLITAADSYSIWILNKSLTCELDTTGNCFGTAMTAMIVFVGVTNIATGGFGSILIIILGIIALLIVLVQIVLMIARGAILVVLCGTLTLSASATNTQRGGAWFQKVIGWILAFILYKPAAATIYASAFRLTGTDPSESGNAIITAMSGIMLLVLALIALPALMRTIVPAVGAVASSAGGGAAGAALGAAATSNPSGAVDVAKRGLGMLGGKSAGGAGASGSSDAGGSGGSGGGGDARNVGADTTGAAAPVAASTAGTAATAAAGGPVTAAVAAGQGVAAAAKDAAGDVAKDAASPGGSNGDAGSAATGGPGATPASSGSETTRPVPADPPSGGKASGADGAAPAAPAGSNTPAAPASGAGSAGAVVARGVGHAATAGQHIAGAATPPDDEGEQA